MCLLLIGACGRLGFSDRAPEDAIEAIETIDANTRCGNGACDDGESPATCAQDCACTAEGLDR
jgi:hypothetical protein